MWSSSILVTSFLHFVVNHLFTRHLLFVDQPFFFQTVLSSCTLVVFCGLAGLSVSLSFSAFSLLKNVIDGRLNQSDIFCNLSYRFILVFQANSCPLDLCQFLLILKDPVQIYHSETKLQKLCHCHGPNCIHRGGSETTFLFQKIIYVIQIPDKRQELNF